VNERIRFISHQKKQNLLVDFSKCPSVGVEKIARAVTDHVTTQPRGSILVLSDFTVASFDQYAIRTMNETAVFDKHLTSTNSDHRNHRTNSSVVSA
jgi:hypothetical protein